jgi:acyl-CoA reductase-like NAD-dependent aldehyde dehydrogenase
MGDPADERTDLGPLARRPQLEVLESQVRDAVAKGATVLLGGKRCDGRGNYFEPTVLVGVDHRMAVMWEESFGPIIGIQEVRDDEEAVRLMNDTDYGLTAAVYSLDRARAERILSQVNAGSAYWNCCDRVSPRLPWTGRKHSGLGTTLSVAGIRSFVQPKAWHLRGG